MSLLKIGFVFYEQACLNNKPSMRIYYGMLTGQCLCLVKKDGADVCVEFSGQADADA